MTTRSMRQTLLFGVTGLAAALATASGPAWAQAYMPGDTLPRAGNVVGGGGATVSGSGDDMTISYSIGGAGAGAGSVSTQAPRLARALNTTTGEISVEYLEPERATAGREAWLTGGGDDAQLVYTSPHRRR
jgi:hypothetical protein